MKKFLFLLSFLSAGKVLPTDLFLHQMNASDRLEMVAKKDLFIKSWSAIYEKYSLRELNLDDALKFLEENFDAEIAKFDENSEDRKFFYGTQEDGTPVGYISFDIKNSREVIVSEWALLPESFDEGCLRDLLYAPFELLEPNTIAIQLHKKLIEPIEFLESIGFEQDPEFIDTIYSSFIISFAKRCGTCFSDCSERDFDDSVEGEWMLGPEDLKLPKRTFDCSGICEDENDCTCTFDDEDFPEEVASQGCDYSETADFSECSEGKEEDEL